MCNGSGCPHENRATGACSGARAAPCLHPDRDEDETAQPHPLVRSARRFRASVASDAFCPACEMAQGKHIRLRAYTEQPALYCPVCQTEFSVDEVAEHCAALLDGIRADLEHMLGILEELNALRTRVPSGKKRQSGA